MPSNTEISVAQFARLVGTPAAPAVIDVRTAEDVAADPRSLPAADHRDPRAVETWARLYAGRQVVVTCQKGGKLAQGTAARLRAEGIRAETLEGGFEAWCDGGALLVTRSALPTRDDQCRTVWVTRARPKIDRIACPWLIRRFVDPHAVFLYVDAAEVSAVAEVFGAVPFDIDGAFWSHRGERCTFDTMLNEFGLASEALARLATIVRGADTDRHDLAPQAAGLLAASLGFSRMYRDDLEQLDASMALYDALYRWCRDAVEETHDWPASRGRK